MAELVLLYLNSAELRVNELSISRTPITSSGSNFQRLDSHCACLNAIKSWFELFFKIPSEDYIHYPFPIWAQLAYSLAVLYKLSTLDDPAWDRSMVRTTVDLLTVLDQLIANVQQISKRRECTSDSREGHLFSCAVHKIQAIRAKWEARLLEDRAGAVTTDGQNVDMAMPENLPIDFSDDGWLREILGSWDC